MEGRVDAPPRLYTRGIPRERNEGGAAFVCLWMGNISVGEGRRGGGGRKEGKGHDPLIRGEHRAIRTLGPTSREEIEKSSV